MIRRGTEVEKRDELMLSGEEIRIGIRIVGGGWKNLMDGRDPKSNHAIEIRMSSKPQFADFS